MQGPFYHPSLDSQRATFVKPSNLIDPRHPQMSNVFLMRRKQYNRIKLRDGLHSDDIRTKQILQQNTNFLFFPFPMSKIKVSNGSVGFANIVVYNACYV